MVLPLKIADEAISIANTNTKTSNQNNTTNNSDNNDSNNNNKKKNFEADFARVTWEDEQL